MSKAFKSPLKLDSLPVGARVRFGEKPYGALYEKHEGGWRPPGSSWFWYWGAETLLAYHAEYEFTVEVPGE